MNLWLCYIRRTISYEAYAVQCQRQGFIFSRDFRLHIVLIDVLEYISKNKGRFIISNRMGKNKF